jgi:hypothetical protein
MSIATNERESHKAFVPKTFVARDLPASSHTIRLEAMYNDVYCNTPDELSSYPCTSTNSDDLFDVTVMEIPD